MLLDDIDIFLFFLWPSTGEFDHLNDLAFPVLQHNVMLLEFEVPRGEKRVVLIYLGPLVFHYTLQRVGQLQLGINSTAVP